MGAVGQMDVSGVQYIRGREWSREVWRKMGGILGEEGGGILKDASFFLGFLRDDDDEAGMN